jgi:hypothetical protein
MPLRRRPPGGRAAAHRHDRNGHCEEARCRDRVSKNANPREPLPTEGAVGRRNGLAQRAGAWEFSPALPRMRCRATLDVWATAALLGFVVGQLPQERRRTCACAYRFRVPRRNLSTRTSTTASTDRCRSWPRPTLRRTPRGSCANREVGLALKFIDRLRAFADAWVHEAVRKHPAGRCRAHRRSSARPADPVEGKGGLP